MSKKIVAKLEGMFFSYAIRNPHLSTQSNSARDALLTLVDRGANNIYPNHVLVALAGVVGETSFFYLDEFARAMSFGPPNREEYESRLNMRKEKALDYAVRWLTIGGGILSFFFWWWRHQKDSFTSGNVKNFLHRLLEEYFPSKIEATTA